MTSIVYACIAVFIIARVYCDSDLDLTDFALEDIHQGSFDSEDMSKELVKYYKHLAKAKEKVLKHQANKELIEDEKNQAQSFEKLLQNVKKINSGFSDPHLVNDSGEK